MPGAMSPLSQSSVVQAIDAAVQVWLFSLIQTEWIPAMQTLVCCLLESPGWVGCTAIMCFTHNEGSRGVQWTLFHQPSCAFSVVTCMLEHWFDSDLDCSRLYHRLCLTYLRTMCYSVERKCLTCQSVARWSDFHLLAAFFHVCCTNHVRFLMEWPGIQLGSMLVSHLSGQELWIWLKGLRCSWSAVAR